ncbi:uncharacterized protein G2W53_036092 [Senna tora]|uniref:Uncharacterized protein n=1 Tax=Senna tora TaxID=362788 RepID=A0A834SSV5_9FABA|nr:uncharacterized protein G2W53_036092 [Senna tora]
MKEIRNYNNMFPFTSMGGKVDHSVNNGEEEGIEGNKGRGRDERRAVGIFGGGTVAKADGLEWWPSAFGG